MSRSVFDVQLATKIFNITSTQLEIIKSQFDGTVFEGLVTEVEQQTDTQWITELDQQYVNILGDPVIGNPYSIEQAKQVDQSSVISVLNQSSNAEWYDPYITIGELLSHTAEVIDDQFMSNSEYIRYVQNNDIDALRYASDDLEQRYSKLRSYKQTNGYISPAAKFANHTREFDLLLSKDLYIIGNLLQKRANNQYWTDEPAVGDYVLYDVTHPTKDTESYRLVAKVVESYKQSVDLSELVPSASFENPETYTTTEYGVQPISYDSEILDIYPNHYMLSKDQNEVHRLRIPEESRITIFEENPLPLDYI